MPNPPSSPLLRTPLGNRTIYMVRSKAPQFLTLLREWCDDHDHPFSSSAISFRNQTDDTIHVAFKLAFGDEIDRP